MKRCNKCNFESDEFEFCPKCGSKLEKIEEKKDNILDKINTVRNEKNKISESDKKIMIVVFSILFLGAIAGIIFGKKNPEPYTIDDNDSTNTNEVINNKANEETEEEKIKKEIKANTTFLYDEIILNKIGEGKYDAFIKLKRPNELYNNIIWMAIDGKSLINGIKYYEYDDVDNYISTYNIEYYDSNSNVVGKTIYKNNHSVKELTSLTIVSNNGKSTVITDKQINQLYEQNAKEEEAKKERSKYDIEVDAKTLSKVYYNNKLDGNKKYFGKRIKTTGKFTSAEKGKLTGWNVVLVTGERYDFYCSTFADGEEKHFSEYNRGETLIVYAQVDELIGGYLNLKNCDLEKK